MSERGGCADDGAENAVFNEPRLSAFACFIRVSEESFRGQISLPLHCPEVKALAAIHLNPRRFLKLELK